MTWVPDSSTRALHTALLAFDGMHATHLIADFVDYLGQQKTLYPKSEAHQILSILRRGCQFELLNTAARALAGRCDGELLIRLDHCQGLIGCGDLTLAQRDLESLIADCKMIGGDNHRSLSERAELANIQIEARGLLGRLHKQSYIAEPSAEVLALALEAYFDVYQWIL